MSINPVNPIVGMFNSQTLVYGGIYRDINNTQQIQQNKVEYLNNKVQNDFDLLATDLCSLNGVVGGQLDILA